MSGTIQTPIENVFEINRFCLALTLLIDTEANKFVVPVGLDHVCLQIAQAAFRIPYAVVAPTDIRRFFPMKGPMPESPVDLLKRCVDAMFATDITRLQSCDEELRSILPNVPSLHDRWEIVFNWFYLTECVKISEDKSNLISLLFGCGKGFWDVIRHRYFDQSCPEGSEHRAEFCQELLWRSAKRTETFRLVRRPIVEQVSWLLSHQDQNSFWDDNFFRDVFTSELLNAEAQPLKCMSCLNRERLDNDLLSQCESLKQTSTKFLSKSTRGAKKTTASRTNGLICTKSGRPCNDSVVRLLADMISIALWIKHNLKKTNTQSAYLAIYLSKHLAYWLIEFDGKGRKDNMTFPACYMSEDRSLHFQVLCLTMFSFLKNFLDTSSISCYRLWSLVKFDSKFAKNEALQTKAMKLDRAVVTQEKRFRYSQQMGVAGHQLTKTYLKCKTFH